MQTYVYGHKNTIATIKLSLSALVCFCHANPLLNPVHSHVHWHYLIEFVAFFWLKYVVNYKCTFNVFSGSEMLKFSEGLCPLVPTSDRVRPTTCDVAFSCRGDHGFNQNQKASQKVSWREMVTWSNNNMQVSTKETKIWRKVQHQIKSRTKRSRYRLGTIAPRAKKSGINMNEILYAIWTSVLKLKIFF